MDDLRVLFFGDSFVAGVGDAQGRGWVGRVVAAAFAAGCPLTAYALGVRRQTSVEVAARWRAEARQRVTAEADCRVVFAVGANDTTVESGAPRVTMERSCDALTGMLAGAAELGLPAAVVGPPLVDASRGEHVRLLEERFGAVCARLGVPFLPVADRLRASPTWREEQAAGDGAHPAAGGYDVLAQTLIDAGLLKWLQDPPADPPSS